MTEKWTRFLPTKLEKWLLGDEDPSSPAAGSSDPLLSYAPPGVEWSPGGDAQVGAQCPVCGTAYPEDAPPDAACENCGADRPVGGLPPGLATQTGYLDPDAMMQPRRPCSACGGEVDIDGYCMTCGAKQASERDHFREEPARWLAGVCDRGIRHARNEDAMALAAGQEPGIRGVLVVCDGVSTSIDSDVASLAGAQAARDVLSGNQPKGLGTPESRTAAMQQALVEACKAANDAVVAHTALDSANAASATFAAAVVSDRQIFHANLGDSRIYWLPDQGEPVQLSLDHSVAQARMDEGISREEAENGPDAHAITKWLGRDSADTEPHLGELAPEGDGWLLVCSDGLWNYASLPGEVGQVFTNALTAEPQPTSIVDVAERMVTWANDQGGRDNITVSLARLGGLEMLAPAPERAPAPVPVGPRPEDAEPIEDALVFEQPDWAAAAPAADVHTPDVLPVPTQAEPPRPPADAPAPAEGTGPTEGDSPVPPRPSAQAAPAASNDGIPAAPPRSDAGATAPEAPAPRRAAEATPTTPTAIVDTPPAN
ncbi:MAG TPA: protein phosphatase 2C domain-containing protein [Propionibacteriaceae bacterium]|nr:protein phosphatase 2C domain-containing protein [Propionibacteriaceae bacterium]